jgi:hypothetical protein
VCCFAHSENSNSTERIPCVYLYEDYGEFATKVWPWIDLCVFSLVPLSIIVVCNIAIVIKVTDWGPTTDNDRASY